MPDLGSHTVSGLLKTSLALHGERKKAVGESLRDRSLRSVCSFPQVPRILRKEAKMMPITFTYEVGYHSLIFRQCAKCAIKTVYA